MRSKNLELYNNNFRIYKSGMNIILENVTDFILSQTLECGQCFRFYKQDEEDYVIVARGSALHIKQEKEKLIFMDETIENVVDIWIPYFDLNRDYNSIKNYLLSKDDVLKPAIEEKCGVRILNQEFHEMVISFIISQNKQIPHIKQIVKNLSEKYGNYLATINGEEYYSFPDIKTLSHIKEEDYRELKTGFRAPYLYDASQKLADGSLDYNKLKLMNEEITRKELLKVKGIGEKVANCIMLFSLNYRASFPIDVWIKRIMEDLYFQREATKEEIAAFAKEQYGEYGGYAQQYLFSYGRDMKIGVKEKVINQK